MIELVVIGATLTIAVWASGAHVHRRNAASRALDRYAQSRSLVFVPAPSKPQGASPRVLGAKDGVPYVFDLYRLNKDVRTRVSTSVERGVPPVLEITQRNAFYLSKPAAFLVGDQAFDRAYIVTTGASEDAEALRTAVRPLLLLLAERRDGVWLSSDRHRVNISWRGAESDPVVLDAARDAILMIVGWHRPDLPYR